MAYNAIGGFPSQQLSFNKKREDWLGKCKNPNLGTEELSDMHRKYDNHVFLVYMHINKINGKVYVGITHHANPNKRWGYSGQKYTHCKKFVNAINKYGWDNFEHIILCRTNREHAIAMETALIAFYKAKGISYNLAEGGEGADCITEENRKKISKRMRENHPMKGKHHTLEARKKISEANKNRVYTEEQKNQIRKAGELGRKKMQSSEYKYPEEARKKLSKHLSKPVFQLDLEGNILREFSSAIEADRFCSSGKRQNHVSDVCNGKRKTAYGYKWVYKTEERRAI